MEVLESRMLAWIEQQNSNAIPISKRICIGMAQVLHESLEKEKQVKVPFLASDGWFHRFCKRSGLRSLKLVGESAGIDKNIIANFSADLTKLIQEGSYSLDQVWNVDESGLHWKFMPDRSYTTGKAVATFKQKTNRATILVGKYHLFHSRRVTVLFFYRGECQWRQENTADVYKFKSTASLPQGPQYGPTGSDVPQQPQMLDDYAFVQRLV